jgi:hypothetical protein
MSLVPPLSENFLWYTQEDLDVERVHSGLCIESLNGVTPYHARQAYLMPIQKKAVDKAPYKAFSLRSMRGVDVGKSLPPALECLGWHVNLFLLQTSRQKRVTCKPSDNITSFK